MRTRTISRLLRTAKTGAVVCCIALVSATISPIIYSNKSILNFEREDNGIVIALSSELSDCYALADLAQKSKIPAVIWNHQTGMHDVFDMFSSAGVLPKNIYFIAPNLPLDENNNVVFLNHTDRMGGFILYHPKTKDIIFPNKIGSPLLIIGSPDEKQPSHETSLKIYESITGKTFFPNGRFVWTSDDNVWLALIPDSIWGNHVMSDMSVNFISLWLEKHNNIKINTENRFTTRIFIWCVTGLLTLVFLLLSAIFPQKQAILFEEKAIHNSYHYDAPAFYLKRIPWIIASIPLALLVYFPLRMLIIPATGIHQIIFLSLTLSGMLITGLFLKNAFKDKRNQTHIKALFEWSCICSSVCTVLFVMAVTAILSFSGFWPFKAHFALTPQDYVVWLLFVIGLSFVEKNTLVQNVQMRSDRDVVYGMLMIFLPALALPIVFIPFGGLSDAVSLARSCWMFLCTMLTAKICLDKTGMVLYSAVSASLLPAVALWAQYVRYSCNFGGI